MLWILPYARVALAMSLVAAAFLALLPLLMLRYRAAWLYAVSILLLLGFLIPVRPAISLPVAPPVARVDGGRAAEPMIPPEAPGAPAAAGGLAAPARAAERRAGFALAPQDWLGLLWLAGAASYLGAALIGHARRMRFLKRHGRPVDDPRILALFARAKGDVHIRRQVGLTYLGAIDSPALVGLARPTVLIDDLALGDQEFLLLFRHELTHCRHGDVAVNWATLLAVSLHWFNPAVHLLAQAKTALGEMACDQAVAKGIGQGERMRYGRLLLHAARPMQRRMRFTPSMIGGKLVMKKRLQAIFGPPRRAGLLIALLFAALALSAGLGGAAEGGTRLYTVGAGYEDWDRLAGIGAFAKAGQDYTYGGAPVGLVLDQGPDGQFRLLLRTGFIADKPLLQVQRDNQGVATGFAPVAREAAQRRIDGEGYWLAPSAWYRVALFARGEHAPDLATLTALDPDFQTTPSGYTYRGQPVEYSFGDQRFSTTLMQDYSSYDLPPLGFEWDEAGAVHSLKAIAPGDLGAFLDRGQFGVLYAPVSNHGQDFAVRLDGDARQQINETLFDWLEGARDSFLDGHSNETEKVRKAIQDGLLPMDWDKGVLRANLTLPQALPFPMDVSLCLEQGSVCLGTLCDLGTVEPGQPLGAAPIQYVPAPGSYTVNILFSSATAEDQIPILYGCSYGFSFEMP